MNLKDIKNEEDLSQFAYELYEESGLFTDKQLYAVSIVLDEWARVQFETLSDFENIDELRYLIRTFIGDDADYYQGKIW